MSDLEASHPEPVSAPASMDVHNYNKHVKSYVVVGFFQVVFTLVTVAVAYWNFGSAAMRILAVLCSAGINAGIVASILMHLKGEKQFIWRVLIFTGIFTVMLFFLTYMAWSDPISETTHSHH